jgi:hypothetical protein
MKRAQIQTKVLVYIATAFAIILLLLLAYKFIATFKEKMRHANVVEVESEIKSGVDFVGGEYGSAKQAQVRVPADTELICFVDLSKRQHLLESDVAKYPEIRDSLENYVLKNVFLISKNKVTDMLYVGNLCLSVPYYRCIETPEHLLKILLKGRKDCVNIIRPIPSIKINNMKNMSKYTPKPIFMVKDTRDVSEMMNTLRIVPLAFWNNRAGGIISYPFYIYYERLTQPADQFIVDYLLLKHGADELRFFTTPPNSLVGDPRVRYEALTEENYRSYWSWMVDVVVINRSNARGALISSLFASYLVAPLVYVDKNSIYNLKTYLNGTRVYVIDEIDDEVIDFLDAWSKEFLQFDSEDLRRDAEINPYDAMMSNITPAMYIP